MKSHIVNFIVDKQLTYSLKDILIFFYMVKDTLMFISNIYRINKIKATSLLHYMVDVVAQ